MCSLAPESKSHMSDFEAMEQENMEDIPDKGLEMTLLALETDEGTDDEGSKFTC
jgi:hypothetical protein